MTTPSAHDSAMIGDSTGMKPLDNAYSTVKLPTSQPAASEPRPESAAAAAPPDGRHLSLADLAIAAGYDQPPTVEQPPTQLHPPYVTRNFRIGDKLVKHGVPLVPPLTVRQARNHRYYAFLNPGGATNALAWWCELPDEAFDDLWSEYEARLDELDQYEREFASETHHKDRYEELFRKTKRDTERPITEMYRYPGEVGSNNPDGRLFDCGEPDDAHPLGKNHPTYWAEYWPAPHEGSRMVGDGPPNQQLDAKWWRVRRVGKAESKGYSKDHYEIHLRGPDQKDPLHRIRALGEERPQKSYGRSIESEQERLDMRWLANSYTGEDAPEVVCRPLRENESVPHNSWDWQQVDAAQYEEPLTRLAESADLETQDLIALLCEAMRVAWASGSNHAHRDGESRCKAMTVWARTLFGLRSRVTHALTSYFEDELTSGRYDKRCAAQAAQAQAA